MRIAAAGVCRSDLHVMDGTWTYDLPMVLGHEGAGVVDAVGPGVLAPRVGDAVALAWVTACGRCRACASGAPALCEIGSHLHRMPDGSSRLRARGQDLGHFMATACFAEHVVVPATQAVELPEGTDLEVAALIGCAAMTGVGAVFNTAAVRPGERAVVFGCGGVGQCIVQGLRAAGAHPIVAVDVTEAALELARASGATDTVLAGSGDDRRAIRRATRGGADVAFEALGRPATIEAAYDSLAPRRTGDHRRHARRATPRSRSTRSASRARRSRSSARCTAPRARTSTCRGSSSWRTPACSRSAR